MNNVQGYFDNAGVAMDAAIHCCVVFLFSSLVIKKMLRN